MGLEADTPRYEEGENNGIAIYTNRNIPTDSAQTLKQEPVFRRFVAKGWLSEDPRLYRAISDFYGDRHLPLPSFKDLIHLEVFMRVRGIMDKTGDKSIRVEYQDLVDELSPEILDDETQIKNRKLLLESQKQGVRF